MLLQQIRCFVTVAESGSFTSAARSLNLSQPALGAHVKNLEGALGVRLFDRHSRGVALTGAGHAFLAEARQVLDAVARARAAVEPFLGRQEVQVSLGITPTSGKTLVPDLLVESAVQAPERRLYLRPGLSDDHRRMLLSGTELDAAFCYDPEPNDGLLIHPLYEEDLFLVGAPDALDRVEGPVPFAHLPQFPLVLRRTLPAVVALGLLALVRPIVQRKIQEGGLGWRACTTTLPGEVPAPTVTGEG